MNSNKFPTQSSTSSRTQNTPAPVAQGNPGSPMRRPPVAAVIRPMQPVAGTDRSVRVDAAEPQAVRPPHVRTHQLEDYVKWLREQSGSRNQNLNRTDSPARYSSTPITQAKTTNVKSANSHPLQNDSVSRNSAQSTSRTSIDQQHRIDPAHARDGSQRAAPQPNVLPSDFQFDADLERILKKLNMPEVLLPSKPTGNPSTFHQSTPVPSTTNEQPDVGLSKSGSSANRGRVDARVDTNEIIRSVAQAIASVLTDQSDATIESKIRQHLQNDNHELRNASDVDSHRSVARETPPLSTVSDLTRQRERQVAASPVTTQKMSAAGSTPPATGQQTAGYAPSSENSQPDKIQNYSTASPSVKQNVQHGPAIPTTIAAWDVDDFRWPKVSTQMISAGATAIETLAKTVFQSLEPHQKRVGVISPGRGEGTTSIAISLARWAAACGLRVLLVDADLANPGLSSQVGLGPNISWVNAVSSSLDPAEVTIRSQTTPLCIMPLAPILTRVSWPRFIYDQLGDLINQVADGFELIVFDLGPANQLVAELSQSRLLIDTGLIVHNGNSSSQFLHAKERLERFGLSRFVVAQNAVQPSTRANVA